MESPDDIPLLCHRCGKQLAPGSGDLYVVRILAVADPYPPAFDEDDLHGDLAAEIDKLLEEMRGASAAELTDQVFRRLIVHLCARCYAEWIEDPTG